MQLLDLFHRARALKTELRLVPALLEMEGGSNFTLFKSAENFQRNPQVVTKSVILE